VRSLEYCCSRNGNSMSIAKIIKNGTNSVFTKFKETLLVPDLQLKETCQRLSGLVSMINRFRECRHSNPNFSVLGRPVRDVLDKDDKVSDLKSFLASEIYCRVREVLGKPEDENFFYEKGDVEDSSEDVYGSDEGEQDKGFSEHFCMQFRNAHAFDSLYP
jgi:hypothetical protein